MTALSDWWESNEEMLHRATKDEIAVAAWNAALAEAVRLCQAQLENDTAPDSILWDGCIRKCVSQIEGAHVR